MKNIKAVIFDFDDTIVDTTGFFFEHLHKTLLKIYGEGYDKELVEKAKDFWSKNLGFEEIFQQTFGDEWENVLSTYREDAMETRYQPKEGMLEYVSELLQKGTKLYILSNRTNKLAERLEQAGFDSNVFKIYAAVEKKPSQLAYSEVFKDIEDQGIELEEVKIYGNHTDDFEALPTELRANFEYVKS